MQRRCHFEKVQQHGGLIVIKGPIAEPIADQLLEKLTIILESPDENEREEQIEFPSVDQMMNVIQNKNKEKISANQTWKFQQPPLGSFVEKMKTCCG